MTAVPFRPVVGVILFLLIFLSGFSMMLLRKPYSVLILTVHKLIGLAAGVLLLITVIIKHRGSPLTASEWSAAAITALLFIADAATGALLSGKQDMPAIVSLIHKIAPFLTVAASVLTANLMVPGLWW